jgi:hypothetical protein
MVGDKRRALAAAWLMITKIIKEPQITQKNTDQKNIKEKF